MERQLFSWIDWSGDDGSIVFHCVTLKVQIGEHPPETYFDVACIDQARRTASGKLILQKDGIEYIYDLCYQVGNKIN